MYSSRVFSILISLSTLTSSIHAWTGTINRNIVSSSSKYQQINKIQCRTKLNAFEAKDKQATTNETPIEVNDIEGNSNRNRRTIEETTEAYGLEAGLFQSLKEKDGGQSAKDLLKKYGVAYLATSIPLAIVSFAICYFLVDAGVDVGGLLGNIGIEVNESGEKVGTFAIAYAAHKAASPIRFPPTVLLTPVVAKMIGKEPSEEEVSA